MIVNFFNEERPTMPTYVSVQEKKKYGFFKFAFDCLMFFITGGLWLIWIFVREMRKR
jgi:hypothetical protein